MKQAYLNTEYASGAGLTGSARCMTHKQKRFVDEYLLDLNATQAAIRAGYSRRTARQIGQENLSKPDIRNYIRLRQKQLEIATGVKTGRVIQELARIAFADVRRLFDDQGRPLPLNELDSDTACAVTSLNLSSEDTSDRSCRHYQVRLANKIQALDMLMKHLGLYDLKRFNGDDNLQPSLPQDHLKIIRNRVNKFDLRH